ncbi:hypothetical protein BGZ82_003356 [Podila clonocystis]|nr:hypothetical protein BGZ82_003356 [Podila clonocystis]
MYWRDEKDGEDTDSDEEMGRTGAEDPELEEGKVWSVQDLYHGLVPQDLYMVDRFASSIEEFGCIEIWNNRCNVTIAWEKPIDITPGNKKIRSSSGNDNFNALNPQHRKPELKVIHSIADTIVMESYLGDISV